MRAASEIIGGPRGRYAVSRELPWVLTAALLSALTAVTAGFGILLRVPCLRTGFAGRRPVLERLLRRPAHRLP